MNSLTNSESALNKFAEKINFTELEGKPEDFFKAGLVFVENGQFDDGIIEFIKIIKTVSHQDILFVDTVKELKSMGFTSADISAISGSPEVVKGIVSDPVLTVSTPVVSKNTTPLAGAIIITIIIIIFGCLSIFSDTSPEGYERSGNFVFAVVVMFPVLIYIALQGLIPAVIASKKGHNFYSWWFFGFVLFVPALILAILAKPITEENTTRYTKTDEGNGLEKFIEKIDFSKLTENPDFYYKTGVALTEQGEYDDGIIEFIKVIKITSLEDELHIFARKELESMGFSKADIDGIRKHKNA